MLLCSINQSHKSSFWEVAHIFLMFFIISIKGLRLSESPFSYLSDCEICNMIMYCLSRLVNSRRRCVFSLTLWTGQAGRWGAGCTLMAGRSGWRSSPAQRSTGAPEGAGAVPLPPYWWHQRTKGLALNISMQRFDSSNMNSPSNRMITWVTSLILLCCSSRI